MALLRGLVRLGLGVLLATLVAAVLASGWMRLTREGPGTLAEPVDAAIVLGASVSRDGYPGLDTHRRVRMGVALLEAGLAGRLILSGGGPADKPQADAVVMRAHALRLGADPDRLLIEPRSTTTFENLRFSFAIAEREGLDQLALVSDGYHLTRAWALAAWHRRADVSLVAARGFGGEWWPHRLVTFTREALAWWYNLAKIAAWEGMAAADIPEETRARWVR